VAQALASLELAPSLKRARAVDVVAVGKAAHPMAASFTTHALARARSTLSVGLGEAGHPVPDPRSVAAATRALDVARGAGDRDLLVVLLSGGASALMALPAAAITLEDKQLTVRSLLAAGADITELNTVRKHVSRIKGGRLAAACAGTTLTLAVSDVVGDDLSVIGSGPTIPDPSTWEMALGVIDRRGGRGAYPRAVVDVLERGAAGLIAETPKPGDPRMARSHARVIGGRMDALEGARLAAESLGYRTHVIADPIVGIARDAGRTHAGAVARIAGSMARPACILSAGETTVRVAGRGTGGRNQEFALAMGCEFASMPLAAVGASVGTDGIDGPTDAAGAIVDATTLARAAASGLQPGAYLDDNDSYTFFETLQDLIKVGPTNTNVGDIQVVLLGK
jgi:glycerate 2-kinase